MTYYLDTSVLVAYYVPELLSSKVQQFLQNNPQPVISELTHLEFYSALAIRTRTNTLTSQDAAHVTVLFEQHLSAGYFLKQSVTNAAFDKAREFIPNVPIKAPDALHASICFLNGYSLVTADEKLARYARQLGITTELIN